MGRRTDAGDSLRMLAAFDVVSQERHKHALLPQAEARVGVWMARSTIYAVSIAAGMLVHHFVRWRRVQRAAADATLKLLADERRCSRPKGGVAR